jgi:hypothetical protein
MVGLPEAVDRSSSDRAKELVVPRILHDALNIVRNRRCLQMDIEAVASGKAKWVKEKQTTAEGGPGINI